MNRDVRLLAEAYGQVVHGREERLEHTLNLILDLVKERSPELYQEIVSAGSAEGLEQLLGHNKEESE